MRIFVLSGLLAFSFLLHGQPCPQLDAELALLNYASPTIPENLGSTRTAVMICHQVSPAGESWRQLAEDIHGSLVQMSIDPVLYLNAFDFYANDLVNRRFEELLKERRIRNLIILQVRDSYEMELVLTPLGSFAATNGNGKAWRASASGAGGLLYQLGTAVKQADLTVSNFLIATKPEFLEDIDLFRGNRLANYAGAMRRQKVGLALMEELPTPSSLNETQRAQVESYNAQVRATNERMQEVFEQFEYEWQPIVYISDEAAMGDRIQYIVFLLHTSGEHIRKMLNYEIDKNETDYLSVTPGNGGEEVNLKRLSAESLMYKAYVKQTRSNDVFVGREWDADDNAPDALRNFIFTWYRQVEGGR